MPSPLPLLATFLALACGFASPDAFGKPARGTALAEAALAPEVLLAEVEGDLFTELREGQRQPAAHESDYWVGYRVLGTLKAPSGGARAVGGTLRVRNKSNNCLPFPGTFVREGGVVLFVPDAPRPDMGVSRHPVSSGLARGTRVLLFLDQDGNHFGWFASPKPWTPDLERRVRDLLRRK